MKRFREGLELLLDGIASLVLRTLDSSLRFAVDLDACRLGSVLEDSPWGA